MKVGMEIHDSFAPMLVEVVVFVQDVTLAGKLIVIVYFFLHPCMGKRDPSRVMVDTRPEDQRASLLLEEEMDMLG
jgi:hypothetical protein